MNAYNIMYVCMDMVGIAILSLMYFNFGYKYIKKSEMDDKLFSVMLVLNILLLVTDMLMWLLNGKMFWGARNMNIASTVAYYIMHPMICCTWLLYCDYKIYEDVRRIKKRIIIYIMPILITLILIWKSFASPILFNISAENIYSRGKYYFVCVIINVMYFVHAYLVTILFLRKSKQILKKEKIKFLLKYPIVPIVGLIIQNLFLGVSVLWTSSAIALLIIYINLQNTKMTTDALTGINNRLTFESYIDYKIRYRNKGNLLFILMIDIDKFKSINDNYGHLVGDEALKDAAKILASSVKRSDFVARLGGDEFVVIGERGRETAVIDTIKTINDEIHKFTMESDKPYVLSMSIGYAVLAPNEIKSVDELTSEADERMYIQKQSTK
ncbi:diguanylate cyclase (GGDEF) domain-containing protein [Hathewaya proteolytica DSM 3090]|uniref:Diguanylate cyclase (GGDEF) domain-containing protein n=1 Tax=Hathewaya proteolytica DSM 3090 TaxID=1121331 RepID=A0A1M6M903_9CLOT|nr:GGDEF domain-containing protein [Hathewaya proteolytica]SHJ79850.1 diguanylate cyclase (GGDEF) domain-containing protein [Hathewaya proteolytica DSM 3090]